MSAAEKLNNHQDEMMQEVQHVQELMSKSTTGSKMMEASVVMAGTEEMNNLMSLIGNPEVAEEERMLLAQYMGEMLKRDASQGMVMFAQYLKATAANPQYEARKVYYLEMALAAIAVHETAAYQDYIVAYQTFEGDASPEAKAAREATETMQAKMRQWAEM